MFGCLIFGFSIPDGNAEGGIGRVRQVGNQLNRSSKRSLPFVLLRQTMRGRTIIIDKVNTTAVGRKSVGVVLSSEKCLFEPDG